MTGKRSTAYQPLFPYFGGKSAVAELIWEALGMDVTNYVEPFAGSSAVLFLRPNVGRIETINDKDGFISNVWRAVKHDPEGVAEYADNPVNECDLHARHLWLVGQREPLTDRLCGDDEFYDVKAAGYWLWGMSCWIGSGWCSGDGPWTSIDGKMVLGATGKGVNRKLPHLRNTGRGVNRQRPDLGDTGRGVNRQRPDLGDTGRGVNRQRQDDSDGFDDTATPGLGRHGRSSWLINYLGWFADRLRNVRVCCGDWSRVCGPCVTFRHGVTGVLLDPPYADSAARTDGLYAIDCDKVAHDVRAWAIEQGENRDMRIVLCGYDGEHAMPGNWRCHEWQATGGYGLIGGDESSGRANRLRERLWFSPHCLAAERMLFD